MPAGPQYQVVRYHSLLVDWAALPACLEPLAWTEGAHHALSLAEGAAGAAPQQQVGAWCRVF